MLLLPGDPGFYETLNTLPPPGQHQSNFFVIDSNNKLMKNVDWFGLREYLNGGEYEELMEEEDIDLEENASY